MSNIQLRLECFKRAAIEIGAHGDNDTLPFDIETKFVKDRADELAAIAFDYCSRLESGTPKEAKKAIEALPLFSERLLAPTGPVGFRITTKIHPFWNLYLNGIGIAVAEVLEPIRSARAHSYRFVAGGDTLFDRNSSWRAFRETTVNECKAAGKDAVIVQTDISSFYDHVSHHRLENSLSDLLGRNSTIPVQIDRLLSKLAAGRSFGLPVGGQCSRILAELLLNSVDRVLSDARITWRRYVDDIVLITASQEDAYRALATLSHAVGDYGLSLNKTKTTVLTAKHFVDYVDAQLGGGSDETKRLMEIDLHFDPYSDSPDEDYEELRGVVETLNIGTLLNLELLKAQPDTFLMSQISRTLRLHDPKVALQLCGTLLSPMNLHAFRASWPKIMRGVAAVCADEAFSQIFDGLDLLLDAIPRHSQHLLRAEASCLHYLRTLRFRRTSARGEFVFATYAAASSKAVKRACIDCWRHWEDRASFTRERNNWNSLSFEEQRMLWFAAGTFGDEGRHFRQQARSSVEQAWRLGIEADDEPKFAAVYVEWAGNAG